MWLEPFCPPWHAHGGVGSINQSWACGWWTTVLYGLAFCSRHSYRSAHQSMQMGALCWIAPPPSSPQLSTLQVNSGIGALTVAETMTAVGSLHILLPAHSFCQPVPSNSHRWSIVEGILVNSTTNSGSNQGTIVNAEFLLPYGSHLSLSLWLWGRWEHLGWEPCSPAGTPSQAAPVILLCQSLGWAWYWARESWNQPCFILTLPPAPSGKGPRMLTELSQLTFFISILGSCSYSRPHTVSGCLPHPKIGH